MVFGLSPEFFNSLKKHHGKLPKERKSIVGSLLEASPSPEEEASESEEEGAEESEVEMPVAPQPAPRGRGRGGRGSRGGRGRGGRGRGRGGRGRGGITKSTSYTPSRTARSTGAVYPRTEDDDGLLSNQSTPMHGAKPPSRGFSGTDSDDDNEEAIEDDSADEFEHMPMPKYRGGPNASGLAELINRATEGPKSSNKNSVPKIALLPESASQTPRESASTPAESAVPKLLAPEEDVLSESDLPDPFIEDAPSPIEAECEDRADYLLQKRFKPMADVQAAIAALTKFPAGQRSTENLYALAENAQYILKAWQDEYLTLDARVSQAQNLIHIY